MYCLTNIAPATCGVGVLSHFRNSNNQWDDFELIPRGAHGGAGWDIAGFINTKECQEAFQFLCKHRKVILQSPVRTNQNSGNKFFFCVYDRKRGKNTVAVETNWPFKDWLGEK